MGLMRSRLAALAVAAVGLVVRVTTEQAAPRGDVFGRWSPDGGRIVFTSDRSGDPEIYVMAADGTGLTRLTDAPGRDAHPDFSPDGRQIAFQSPRAGDGTHLYVMRAGGADQRRITSLSGFSGVPVWSPDGSRLAFQRTERPARRRGICIWSRRTERR